MPLATGKELDAILSQMTSGNPFFSEDRPTDVTRGDCKAISHLKHPHGFGEPARWYIKPEGEK